jgi:hypothetical protein
MDVSYLHICLPAQGSPAAAFDAVGRAVRAMPGWAAAPGDGAPDRGSRVWRHLESGTALLAVAVGLDPLVISIGRDPSARGGGERPAREAVATVRRAVPAIGGRVVADWELLALVRQAQERLEWRALAEAREGGA